jgi:hypothetical protein
MKLKATKKQIKENYFKIHKIGYCEAQHLLYFKNPFAYSCGVYGWSCDYYAIGNVCISTGYSPIGTDVDYKLLREYDDKASKIINNYDIEYQDRVQQVNDLLNEFISKL